MKKIALLTLLVLPLYLFGQTFKVSSGSLGGNVSNLPLDTVVYGVATVDSNGDIIGYAPTTSSTASSVPIFVFGGGGGNATDTVAFTTSTIYGAFKNYGTDTIVVTAMNAVMAHGIATDSINVQVYWHATFLSGSATTLNTSSYKVTSITTGDQDTSFANSKIPPGAWVWMKTPTVNAGHKPTYLCVTLSGYRK